MSELINKCREDFIKQYKSIYDSLDNMRDSLSYVLAEADTLSHLLELQVPQKWHTSEEIPSEDSYYIVATDNGAVFVSRPVLGKWIRGIAYWMEIPQLPQ